MVTIKAICVSALLLGNVLAASRDGQAVPDSYLVKLKKSVGLDRHVQWVDKIHRRSLSSEQLSGIRKTFSGVDGFLAYTGHFNKATLDEIRKSPDVDFVEEDKVMQLDYLKGDESTYTEPINHQRGPRDGVVTQKNATWGLAAVSHRESGGTSYIYDETAGEGLFAYIVDTGIRDTHEDFQGRASRVYSAFPDDDEDTDGHGTHVAGTIGGATYGVAKASHLLAVKVYQDQSSTSSFLIEGYTWAVADIISKGRQNSSVINLSAEQTYSNMFNELVRKAATNGITTIVAAGNEAFNAFRVSPASEPTAITVGAIDSDFRFSNFTNFGRVVDIFAPGTGVRSASNESDTSVHVRSGTSMATPHVAGLALYAMSSDGVKGPEEIRDHLVKIGTKDKIIGTVHGSANVIGNNGNPRQ